MADGGGFQSGFEARPPKGLRNRIMASRKFQAWAARFPLTRRFVRKEGDALFDLMAGFCHSQILMALAELRVPERLLSGPVAVELLARELSVPIDRAIVLLRGGASIGVLKMRSGKVSLTQRGAAFATVPGLSAMVRHHRAFYRDLEDPVAFFRGETETELAEVWPYVFGDGVGLDKSTAGAYSELMAQSQALVAEDTLRMIDLSAADTIMDVGGGTGAFLEAVGGKWADLNLVLFDLPDVAPIAQSRFETAGLADRARIESGSFKTDGLPAGADVISLVRVLYDHSDETVKSLLKKAHDALPEDGRIIISEPMSGGARPDKATDAYFALYTMAMRTGRTRSAAEISDLLTEAGFQGVKTRRPYRSYVTSVVTGVKNF